MDLPGYIKYRLNIEVATSRLHILITCQNDN